MALALSPDTRWALIMDVDTVLGGAGSSVNVVPTGAGESRRLPDTGLDYARCAVAA